MANARSTNNDMNAMINDYLDKKNQYINDENQKVQTIFNDLSNKSLAEIDDLKKQVDSQNDAIEKQLSLNSSESNDSNYMKSEYQQIEIDKLKHQNFIMYFVFYILVLILGVVMFYMNTTSIVFQTVVFHVLLVYPFIIYYSEFLIYYVYQYLNAFFSSSRFSNIYVGDY